MTDSPACSRTRSGNNTLTSFPVSFRARVHSRVLFLLCSCLKRFAFLVTLYSTRSSDLLQSAPQKVKARRSASYDSIETQVSSKHAGPVPLRGLLIFPVIISVSNYVSLAFLNIAFNALFPLFLAMPREIGGLDMPPSTIGYIMGSYGLLCGVYQFLFFTRIIHALGERRVFINGMMVYPLIFALFPVISMCAGTWLVWVGLAVIITALVVMDMSFGTSLSLRDTISLTSRQVLSSCL